MPATQRLIALLLAPLLALMPALGVAQSADPGLEGRLWWSYRDAYRALVRFEKLDQPKQGLQQRLQVQPRNPGHSIDGLRLSLLGRRTALELPLDAAGQAQVPLMKSAFDDNAALVLNRSAEDFGFRIRVSIAPRPDGVYALNELRSACAQVLALQRQFAPERVSGKQCKGVSLAFAREGAPSVSLRQADAERRLATTPGPLYPGEPDRLHSVLMLRWEHATDDAELRVASMPLVIAAVIE